MSSVRGPGGAPLTRGRVLLQAEGAQVAYRKIELRPLLYSSPPAGASVLFGGQNLSQWQSRGGQGPASWPVQAGATTVAPSTGGTPNDVRSAATFRDFQLHLEFRLPTSSADLPEQQRGNSGVYLQGRYEVQILDSYGRGLDGRNDLGAIYGVKDAASNASLPSEIWQSYDIDFRAARWSGGQKTENARVSVRLNGELIQDRVSVPGSTLLGDPEGPGDGPIVLQDHGDKVQFRNIWLRPAAN
ncbi:MAG: 3-keto-disaccharide hydrolase [Deinococcus sp.]